MDLDRIYGILLREVENDTVQEIPPDFYELISNYIGEIKSEGYDGFETKIKSSFVNLVTKMTELFLEIRIYKSISNSNNSEISNLLDVEKYIMDSNEELEERKRIILTSTLKGKSKLLGKIGTNHKTTPMVVRFIKNVDQIVGSDLEKYGPFKSEDLATLPFENAQALIQKKVVEKVRWED